MRGAGRQDKRGSCPFSSCVERRPRSTAWLESPAPRPRTHEPAMVAARVLSHRVGRRSPPQVHTVWVVVVPGLKSSLSGGQVAVGVEEPIRVEPGVFKAQPEAVEELGVGGVAVLVGVHGMSPAGRADCSRTVGPGPGLDRTQGVHRGSGVQTGRNAEKEPQGLRGGPTLARSLQSNRQQQGFNVIASAPVPRYAHCTAVAWSCE